LGALGIVVYGPLVLLGPVGFAGAARGPARRWDRPRLALVTVLAFVLLVPVLDVITGSNLSLSAAFGYSPPGNPRPYGISHSPPTGSGSAPT